MAISIRTRASPRTAGARVPAARGARRAAKVNTSIEFESRNETSGEIGNYVKYVNRGKGVSREFAAGLARDFRWPGNVRFRTLVN
jgi:hypothetical protein